MKTLAPLLIAAILTTTLPATAFAEPHVDEGADTASHVELEPLAVKFETLSALRLHPDGNLLASDAKAKQIKVIGPDGKVARTIVLPFGPESINVATDGTIYCGGEGGRGRFPGAGPYRFAGGGAWGGAGP